MTIFKHHKNVSQLQKSFPEFQHNTYSTIDYRFYWISSNTK